MSQSAAQPTPLADRRRGPTPSIGADSTTPSNAEVGDELSKWLVGLGMITMVIFPFALPILALTAVAALPLLLPALAAGLLVAVVLLPFLLVRSLARRAIRALRPRGKAVLHPGLHG